MSTKENIPQRTKFYDRIPPADFEAQTFAFLKVEQRAHVLTIVLDRAEKKNALHPQMVNEIAYTMEYADANRDIWVILIEAEGSVFCAGADLKAFMGMVGENNSTIPAPKEQVLIGVLFNQTTVPIITKVTGDVYAGGFFFLAGAHIVLAQENIKLGLPEVKRGLYPFQVMESLLSVMPTRKVIDWCIRGYNLPVADALQYGLVTEVVPAEEIGTRTEEIIEEIKQNSPTAIRNGIEALGHITNASANHKYLMGMLVKTMSSKDGQEGLKAFREKRPPVWTGE